MEKTKSRVSSRFSEFELRIEKLVYGGWGLGRNQGKVVFVPFSIPGDLLRVQEVERRKNFLRAAIVEVIEPGPGRISPVCSHFGSCGGCQWQNLDYAHQVEAKRQILEQSVRHRFPETKPLPIEMKASPQPYGYRSRARLQIRGRGPTACAGFFRFQSHIVEDIESCPLFLPVLNEALASIRRSMSREALNPGSSQLALAGSAETGAWDLAEIAPDLDDEISATGGSAELSGRTVLDRKVGEFSYQLAPEVFFQVNDVMAEELLRTVRELASAAGTSAALDLYCGAGLFTLALGRQFRQVQAVESSPLACRFCLLNSTRAGLENVRVVCADVGRWMEAAGSISPPALDLILLDPPRSGAGTEVMHRIREWAPENVIYVSCDPQTMVRDLAILAPGEYTIDSIQGLDLFPQTFHFETVVHLTRTHPKSDHIN